MAKSTTLSSVTYSDIQAELRRRHRKVATLQRRRERVARRLGSLDELIAAMGGRAIGRVRFGPGRGRAQNEKSLAEALHGILDGKTMRVTDAAEAVQKAGYKTNSKTFRVQVNIALVKRKDLFKRVGRGRYTAR